MTASSQRANRPEPSLKRQVEGRCPVNNEHQDSTGFLASILGLITTLLAALTQILRLRNPELPRELNEQLEEIEEDIEQLEARLDEQEAAVNALQQHEIASPE